MERQEVADAIRAVQRDHHQTATAFCTCGWVPDPVPLNPDGSGDQDRMEQMREQHVMDVMLDAIDTENHDARLAGLRETWPAFQRDGIDTAYPDTEIVRKGWPKPTMYREHETIHVLCNVIDNLRRELAEARALSDAIEETDAQAQEGED